MKIPLTTCDTYAFVDPAGRPKRATDLKKQRARQAIIVVSVDSLQHIFVRLAWAGRLSASHFRDKILAVYDTFQPRLLGIEANAMQELFAELVRDAATERFAERVRMTPVWQDTKVDKDWRIRTSLEPILNNGRLFLCGSFPDLELELRGFPLAATKDLVDALASVVKLIPARPMARQASDQVDATAKYLRDTGAPPWYIEQRVRELRGDPPDTHFDRRDPYTRRRLDISFARRL